jgi:hypothetical protein
MRHVAPIAAMLGIVYTVSSLESWHELHADAARNDTAFLAMTRSLPAPGAVIFVRYTPGYFPHRTVVANSATLQSDRVWVVNDDPAQNMRVLRAAAGRTPLLFYEGEGRVLPYRPLLDSLAALVK